MQQQQQQQQQQQRRNNNNRSRNNKPRAAVGTGASLMNRRERGHQSRNDEEIKTDELIWDKKLRRITSQKPVRVRIRNEKIIMAEGFESDESFLNYKFSRVTGMVYLDEDEATLE